MTLEQDVQNEIDSSKGKYESFADRTKAIYKTYLGLSGEIRSIFEDKIVDMIKSEKEHDVVYGLALSSLIGIKKALPYAIEKSESSDDLLKENALLAIGMLGEKEQHYDMLMKHVDSKYDHPVLIALSNLDYEKTNTILNERLTKAAEQNEDYKEISKILEGVLTLRIDKLGVDKFIQDEYYLKKTFLSDSDENIVHKKRDYLVDALNKSFEFAEELREMRLGYVLDNKENIPKINDFKNHF